MEDLNMKFKQELLRKTAAVSLVLTLILGIPGVFGDFAHVAADNIGGAIDGTDLTWEIVETMWPWGDAPIIMELQITGAGDMPNFASPEDTPWWEHRDNIDWLRMQQVGMAYIGNNAFRNMGLGNAFTGISITHIGDWAFAGNDFEFISISHRVTHIGVGAFADSNIRSLAGLHARGGSLVSIGDYAFRGNNMRSVTLPESLEHIGAEAFASNT